MKYSRKIQAREVTPFAIRPVGHDTDPTRWGLDQRADRKRFYVFNHTYLLFSHGKNS